ncbi:Stage III sporulation protein SpoIIIAA [Thiohalospira halophila DSM 15071]|uniref:Stage III sporulation protein SpoIIIAA n=1 Tax=Thiohalospira halophila DSM 15071 TaxID=1123397 RepID=A0A1I1P3P1_9GAMM|nr:R3H domain-containing nucleic acid-binding protein [Thiohalospira halophila]SFD00570.1 Stage III sporulation protein SpoIIIAA [Thiohalospira halophila DSM 15071]
MEEQTDDLAALLDLLPPDLRAAAAALDPEQVVEFVLDRGRPATARLDHGRAELASVPLEQADLDAVASRVGAFSADNRAGVEGTLHRIAAIRNRQGRIIGLTLRVGRAAHGIVDPIHDVVAAGESLLLLGRPGVGKTTLLRETARVLADECDRRVVIIDTAGEIAGDGDIPHPAIGSARRMPVADPRQQDRVMIEAVENHMPEVIIVDEIGTEAEARAARTIAERGVQLVATAHGHSLENLLRNPVLDDLVGGVQTVILGDDEARARGGQKTVQERRGPPAFTAVVEIVQRGELRLHPSTARSVDRLLAGRAPRCEMRTAAESGAGAPPPAEETGLPEGAESSAPEVGPRGRTRILSYGVSRDSVDRVIRTEGLPAETVPDPGRTDLVLALRSRAADPRLQRLVDTSAVPLVTVKKNSTAQIRRALADALNQVHGVDDETVSAVVREVEEAVNRVRQEGEVVPLSPAQGAVRRLQHRIVVRHGLVAESQGSGNQRHLVVLPSTPDAG